ncbi:MAG: cation-transporting P-type ATPase [Clostridiales bacterium]|nr:cation-transporting P-type ATPase [Clostridiales bacterium]
MTDKWYDKSIEKVAAYLGTNLTTGLTRETALARMAKSGGNVIYPIPRGTKKLYIRHILTDFTSILLVVTAAISAVLDKSVTALVMIGLVAINTLFMVITYIRAQRVLEDMGQYALPTAKVMRGGRLYLVRAEQLAEGDVIYLTAGDIVPCDARLVESDRLAALETTLTGVPHAVKKDAEFIDYRDLPPSKQANMVFASTVLTSGIGKAVVCAVGGDTLVCKMGKNAPLVSHDRIGVISALHRFCSIWSLVMIGLIFLLTVLDVIIGKSGGGLFGSFITGLALAVSSMSEFFTAFGYIVIATGIFTAMERHRDLNRGAIIKNASKLPALRDINCIIVPKEGVFGTRDLTLTSVFVNDMTHTAGERKFADNVRRIMRYAIISTGLYSSEKLISNNLNYENLYTPEEEAIIRAAEKYRLYNVNLEKEYPLLDHESVSEDNRFETSLFFDGGKFCVAMRGELEEVLTCCDYYRYNGRSYPITPTRMAEIRVAAAIAAKEGCRVIAVASGETEYNNLARLGRIQSALTLEGFMAIREPLLPGAVKSISRLKAAGIKVIMTCADASENNAYLAAILGIAESRDQIITSREMDAVKPGLMRANIGNYTVFEGLTVSQKRFLLRSLREEGAVTGLLARELNELILLRECDVGFAQAMTLSVKAGREGVELADHRIPVFSRSAHRPSRGGCEAVKFLADVCIPEADSKGYGGFNAIVTAIASARVIFLNLRRVLSYLITSQCVRLFTVLTGVFSGIKFLSAAQLLFCGLFLDFAAAIVIAFERPDTDVFRQRGGMQVRELEKNPVIYYLPCVITAFLWALVICLQMPLTYLFDIYPGRTELLAATFIGMILGQIILLCESRKDKSMFIPSVRINRVFMFVLTCAAAFTVCCLALPDFGRLFDVVSLRAEAWVPALVPPALLMAGIELVKHLRSHGIGISLKGITKKKDAADEQPSPAAAAADSAAPAYASATSNTSAAGSPIPQTPGQYRAGIVITSAVDAASERYDSAISSYLDEFAAAVDAADEKNDDMSGGNSSPDADENAGNGVITPACSQSEDNAAETGEVISGETNELPPETTD